jgi:hypothetical protein
LNPEHRGCQTVNFPCLNFLQIARGNFRPFGKFVLRQTFTHPFPAHVRAKDLNSLPLFLGNGHDTLHRFCVINMNDTYIVKKIGICLSMSVESGAIEVSPHLVTK